MWIFKIGEVSGCEPNWSTNDRNCNEQAQHEIDAGLAGEEEKVDIVGRGAKS